MLNTGRFQQKKQVCEKQLRVMLGGETESF